MKKNDYVKLVATNGDYRYGYIESSKECGDILTINMEEEGESKIAYDAEQAKFLGYLPEDYTKSLSDIEKQVGKLLSEGLLTREIAELMNIHPTTVRAHLRTLRIKLHLENKAQLEAFVRGLKL